MNSAFKFRFLGIAAFLAIIAGFSAVAMLLWNALMPEIFGLPVLNYWQTAGLLILARLIFGGGGGMERLGMIRGHAALHQGNPFRERWMSMSADERKQFLNSSHRPGFFGDSPEHEGHYK